MRLNDKSMDWLKGKQVKFLRGPATVREEPLQECHWETGKAARAMILSQKTCLFLIHHELYDG